MVNYPNSVTMSILNRHVNDKGILSVTKAQGFDACLPRHPITLTLTLYLSHCSRAYITPFSQLKSLWLICGSRLSLDVLHQDGFVMIGG